eukprot:gene17564-23130_t
MDITVDDIMQMKVDELKSLLKSHGYQTTGKKADLQNRLINARNEIVNTDKDKSLNISVNDSIAHNSIEKDSEIQELSNNNNLENISNQTITEAISNKIDNIDQSNEGEGKAEENKTEEGTNNDVTVNQSDDLVDYNEITDDIEPIKTVDDSIDKSKETVEPIAIKTKDEEDLRNKLFTLKEKLSSKSNQLVSLSTLTNHVRIDNFQRPLTMKGLHQWLQQTTQLTINEKDLWLNSIKTHCYITFTSSDEAKQCIELVNGKIYPDTNTSTLSAAFTNVSASEAPSSQEGQLKPGQWKNLQITNEIKSNNAGTTSKKSLTISVNNNKESIPLPIPSKSPRNTNVVPDLFKRALKNAAASTNISTKSNSNPESNNQVISEIKLKRNRDDIDIDSKKKSRTEDNYNQPIVEKYDNNEDIILLDDLFKKTKALPHLYWLPVTEEIANKRKSENYKKN